VELTVDSRTLADTLAWTTRFAPARPTVPICAAIHLTATTDGTLTTTATDYATTARANIDAHVTTPGQAAVSSRILAAVTARLGDGPATLRLDGPRLHISCGTTNYTLITMAAEDYPTAPDAPEAIGEVDAADLAAAVTHVASSASTEDALPQLGGLSVHYNGQLTLGATDRYRVTARTLDWTPAGDPAGALLAPPAAITAATRGMTGTITLGADTNLLSLSDGTRTVITTLMDADGYPDLARVLARAADTPPLATATVAVADLVAAIDRAAAIVTDPKGDIRLTVSDDQITVDAGTDDTSATTTGATTTGHLSALYNPRFLTPLVKSLGTAAVTLHLTGDSAQAPTYVTGTTADGTQATGSALIAPKRRKSPAVAA